MHWSDKEALLSCTQFEQAWRAIRAYWPNSLRAILHNVRSSCLESKNATKFISKHLFEDSTFTSWIAGAIIETRFLMLLSREPGLPTQMAEN